MLTTFFTRLPPRFVGSLHPHQMVAAKWLRATPRALLADDVGLGKTISVAVTLDHLRVDTAWDGQSPVLWLTDASLIEPTRAKLQEFTPNLSVLTQNDPAMQPTVKGRKLMAAEWPDGPDVTILSYDKALSWRHSIGKTFPDLQVVVLDEVMNLKGSGARQEVVRELTKTSRRVIAMTATPYENDPMETFAVLRAMNAPGLWPKGIFETFVEWEPGYQLPTGGWVPDKPLGLIPAKLPEVRNYLDGLMLRGDAGEAGLTLPQQVGERLRWVALTAEQRSAYAEAGRLTGLRRHAAQERAGRLDDESSCLLDECMAEITRRPGQKIIVYCETLGVLRVLTARLDAVQIGCRTVEGRIKPDERDRRIADFRDDPDVNILVGSSVLERGLDLQFARVLISLDSSYNPQREHQREGRVCRIGSPHETFEHLTLLPDTPLTRQKLTELERKLEGTASLLNA